MAENTQAANLGFEAKLFLTADKLRGSMDASEYKHVALGLVFLKYISDAFNTVFVKLQADEYADEDDAVAAAREIYLDYRFKQKNGLPVISKRFADVAALCRATMKQQLDNGVGKKSFRDCLGPLKLCQYLLTNGVAKNGTETVFGWGRTEDIARDGTVRLNSVEASRVYL